MCVLKKYIPNWEGKLSYHTLMIRIRLQKTPVFLHFHENSHVQLGGDFTSFPQKMDVSASMLSTATVNGW